MRINGIAAQEQWPLKEPFVISRSSRTHVDVVVVELSDGQYRGRGECQPNSRYGESAGAVVSDLQALFAAGIADDLDPANCALTPAGRNALDCALWDLRAKRAGRRAWDLLGLAAPIAVPTVFTISFAAPDAMADAARRAFAGGKSRLKLKLGGEGDDQRVAAVRAAVPDARLVADANEGWTEAQLGPYLAALGNAGVEMLEQPLPAGRDGALKGLPRPIPLCADESCHVAADVQGLKGKYDFVNIKLDKTGGVTAALELERAARDAGMGVMVGCMLGTSLAMAPAMLIAARAEFTDLDGPLLLAADRDHPLIFDRDYRISAPVPGLWG